MSFSTTFECCALLCGDPFRSTFSLVLCILMDHPFCSSCFFTLQAPLYEVWTYLDIYSPSSLRHKDYLLSFPVYGTRIRKSPLMAHGHSSVDFKSFQDK